MTDGCSSVTILLPPSEGKAPGGDGDGWKAEDGVFGAALGGQRAKLVRRLAKARGGDTKLLGVGGAHLERARAANASLAGAATLPAGARYTGVVYDHLSLATLPPAARQRASESIVVISGLLGAVAIDDPVPDYRLKMGARLSPFGTLSRWWKPVLSKALNAHLADREVIDLLPNDHAGAWTPDVDRCQSFYRVRFVERSGARAVAGHEAKAAKGQLVRHLLVVGGDPLVAMSSFEHDRFKVEF